MRDKYLSRLQTSAIDVMKVYYQSEYQVGKFVSFNAGYEVTINALDLNEKHATNNDGDFFNEVGSILYQEMELDIFDWSIRIKTVVDGSTTTKIIRVEFFDIAA